VVSSGECRLKRIPALGLILSLGGAVSLWSPAETVARNVTFIRDAEVENTIATYATPLFQAAGLEPSAVKIYIIKDNALNAFVAGGQKLFINTGLLVHSPDPGEVIGVIAHEVGHISGGHLSRTHDAMRDASAQAIIAAILGGIAAIGSGRGDLGGAIVAGGQEMAKRSFLIYSRTQESAADQAAVKYLESTGQSARGLSDLLAALGDQELLGTRHQDPYVRTHPITRDRILFVESHVARSRYSDTPPAPKILAMHRRMVGKLRGYIEPTARTLRRYKETDPSVEARYARAVAYSRRPDLARALPLIEGLIAEFPHDPFFHEFRGQKLFEGGRASEALASYTMAAQLMPDSPLILRGLAQVQLELNGPALLESAIANLRAALRHGSTSPFTWRQLAIAHGRNGQIGESALAMAEEAMLKDDRAAARHYAQRAEKLLPSGSAGWLHANDILEATKKEKKKKK
jgi:predicted Zn-dependent protease